LRIDWTQVQDEPVGHVMSDDVITGWMPLPRGNEEDRGYETEVSAGPTSMAISADGSRAYVTNFNDNSLSILDLRAGARGSLVALVRGLDENPYEVELSPDGKLAWVANSYGVQRQGVQHSTLQVVDVDEESATFGQVLTRLSNVDSRAAAGCAAGEAR
jgi:DNA-binding beta-propeller fold protein YncE